MSRFPTILTVILAPFSLLSCEQKTESSKQEERFDKVNYFAGEAPTLALADLKNELAAGETDFLKSLKDAPFPWQKWDASALKKAKDSQKPLFLFLGSTLSGESKTIADRIANTPSLRNLLSKNFVCAASDIYSHPELSLISFILCSEQKRPTTFPAAIWMSHEGSPIAWITISGNEPRIIDTTIKSSSAMVIDIWVNDSRYAITNSASNNQDRKKNLTPLSEREPDGRKKKAETDFTAVEHGRSEIFRRYTRQMSSLYSDEDKDIDYIGGLLPTSTLELLSLGIASDQFTDQVRNRCREAVTQVTRELLSGAIKDPLDGSYYYARRTSDWSLPNFSKNLASQARVAQLLIRVGTILEDQKITAEGLSLLEQIETQWLAKNRSISAPLGDPDEPGSFLIDWPSLKTAIEEADRPLAIAAFSLKKRGNIPSVVDPLDDYFKLNTLRNRATVKELAAEFGQEPAEITARLTKIKSALLKHREEKTEFISESVRSLSDLALILRARVAGSVIPNSSEKITSVTNDARELLKTYRRMDHGLVRLISGENIVSARLNDYALTTLLCLDLYQATLDPAWLADAVSIFEEAIDKLDATDRLPSELSKSDRIIPVRLSDRSMTFSESSLGLSALATSRLAALTGKENFIGLRKRIQDELALHVGRATVNHTDFIAACALGDHDLLAVVKGNPKSPENQALLTLLNSQKHLPFLTVRAESGEAPLSDLEGTPAPGDDSSVYLMRDGKVLGKANTPNHLSRLLSQIISGKNSAASTPQETLPSE